MQIELIIQKSKVLAEVSQTAEYTGDKMTGDDGAYERIRTVEEDNMELGRFWDECRADIARSFMRVLASEGMYSYDSNTQDYTSDANGDYYKLDLNVSNSFDMAMRPSMMLGLFSYFVSAITAKWFVYANKPDTENYAKRAIALLDEVKQKAFYKKAPTRPYHN